MRATEIDLSFIFSSVVPAYVYDQINKLIRICAYFLLIYVQSAK